MEAKATTGMRIVPYTPKSFAVVGETYAHRSELKSMGGAFSKWLKIDGVSVAGWCFSLKREAEVRQFIRDVDNPRQAPKAKDAKPKATKARKSPAKGKKAIPTVVERMFDAYLEKYLKKADSIASTTEPRVLAEKIDSPCSKERIARALAGEAVSAQHWAMRHVLEFGLRPDDVKRGTGLFGKDARGNTFGEKERRSMFWMLNGKSNPIDQVVNEDMPHWFRYDGSEQLFWDIATDFSGAGGKSALVEKCIALAESESMRSHAECPF